MYQTDCVVVGAGVVGLAVARALALAGREVVVLEREGLIGSHTSSRNSEVIHAGIYYPRGSAKARLCVARARPALCLLREPRGAAPAAGQDHRGGGARRRPPRSTASRRRRRPTGQGRSSRSGLPTLARLEPALRGAAGLLSPIDRDRRQPRADAEPTRARRRTHGASLALVTRLVAAERDRRRRITVVAESGGETVTLRARPPGQRRGALRGRGGRRPSTGLAPGAPPRDLLLQGQLLRRGGAGALLATSIYPVPERDGLGVHLTLDLAGQRALRAGHRVDRRHRLQPRRPPRRGLLRSDPQLLAGAPRRRAQPQTIPASARSSIPPGGTATDFSIEGPEVHGVAGPRQPLRHREPGADRLARHRR